VEGGQLRERDAIVLDLVGVGGLVAFLLGLVMLQGSKELGFEPAAALDGVLSQLAVTLPAALLILGATALDLGAALILARSASTRPFDSTTEALLAALVAAVFKDTLLLGLLGSVGLFRAPILGAIDVAIVAALWLPPLSRRVRPLTAIAGWRDALARIPSWPLAALVAIVWAGPIVLQLASPVVPFIDVLPNHVAPVEHLRTFGWFANLTDTQSPIYGASRTVLGYDGLVGAVATMTDVPGVLAVAAFILPETLLVAAGAHRLAGALLRGTPISPGPWALLAFAITQPFARIADVRGTVMVIPLVCLGLALTVETLRGGPRDDAATAPSAWRIGSGAVAGITLGLATMVHPVIGFLSIVTVGVVGLLRPRELGAHAVVGALTGGLIALPQLATMVGISLPSIVLGIWLPLAAGVGIAIGMALERRAAVRAAVVRVVEVGRIALVIAVAAGLVLAFGAAILNADRLPAAANSAVALVLDSSGIVVVTLAVGALLGSAGARSAVVLVGLAVGLVAALLTQVLPSDLGLLGDALRYEVPKTLHYWLSAIAAAGAGAALAHLWSSGRLHWAARAALVAAFVAGAALPLRQEAIDPYHLGEHRFAETFAIDLKYAGSGFWIGYPDRRRIVDAPRQELLDALRAEIDAGRLRHDTPVLHLARSFQQWVAAPLGVFDGVTETFISLDPEASLHTVGGRLFGLDRLPGDLAGRSFPYVVLEPEGLPDGLADQVVAAGYRSIFANGRGEVFALAN
jgi:hypothetical protein